ncbi:hypothetical protein [Azohydromonas lata]|uniref:Lipoprotein n=1 Tax=Azohydromonas lata TaxID=45677 RepID=A0ABU5IKP7_9BURK|nr:hypothetical protein [Azohydromonas lata]MDZ5459459.1 hypothetical protein [Azohydromonas lata]
MSLNYKYFALVLAVSALAGCSANRVVRFVTPFDAEAARKQLEEGSNNVKGSALIRQAGGGVVTCAGKPVFMMPVTAAAKEWAAQVYGTSRGGFHNAQGRDIKFKGRDDMFAAVKTATCDAQGGFKFDRVADGQFYVFTRITWVVAGSIQGGSVMRPVTLSGGQVAEIVLSPDSL